MVYSPSSLEFRNFREPFFNLQAVAVCVKALHALLGLTYPFDVINGNLSFNESFVVSQLRDLGVAATLSGDLGRCSCLLQDLVEQLEATERITISDLREAYHRSLA